MLNLLRSELYKMTRSKSFWVCLIVCAGLAILSAISIYASISMMDQMLGSASLTGGGTDLFGKMGIDAFQQVADLGKQASGLWFGVYAISTQYFQIVAAIFVSIWIGGEFKTGTIRFPVSKGFDRISVYGAKLLVAVIASELFMAVHMAVSWAAGSVIWGVGSLEGVHLGRLAAMLGVQALLTMALASLFVLLATLFRSSGASVAVNICLLMFSSLLIAFLDLLADSKVHFGKYWILQMQTDLSTLTPAAGDVLQGLVTGILYLVATAAIGCLVFRKRDIR